MAKKPTFRRQPLSLSSARKGFRGSYSPDEKNRIVPQNFGLLAIKLTEAAASQTILMPKFISKFYVYWTVHHRDS